MIVLLWNVLVMKKIEGTSQQHRLTEREFHKPHHQKEGSMKSLNEPSVQPRKALVKQQREFVWSYHHVHPMWTLPTWTGRHFGVLPSRKFCRVVVFVRTGHCLRQDGLFSVAIEAQLTHCGRGSNDWGLMVKE